MSFITRNAIVFFSALLSLAACTTQRTASNASSQIIHKQTGSGVTEWQHQKFSMFMHFGLYSVLGGIWKGEQIGEYNEQIRAHAKISKDEYALVAKQFNPVNWNPDSVVALAKAAGMKSIVITSKHHDGFAMYHTKYSEFNVVDATPYKRDILKELSEACRKLGLKFGVYFSLIDWHFPGAMPISKSNSDSIPPSHHQFNLHQVKELMTNYGAVSEVWFDMGKPTYEQSRELAGLVKKLQPACMVSGRIWNDQGDFAVMGDNVSPDFRLGTLWQTPASMFHETWGYRSWQVRENSTAKALEKLTSLIKVVSNGGNYLLNIGPTGDGAVVPYEREVLTTMGAWFNKNSEAIYSTAPSPLPEQSWGVISGKPQKLYLFLLNEPKDGTLLLKGIGSKPTKAYLLSDKKQAVAVDSLDGSFTFNVAGLKSDDLVKVIVVEYKGDLQYVPSKMLAKSSDGSYQLTTGNATKYHSYSGKDYYSTKPTVIRMEWFIEPSNAGKHKLIFQSLPTHKGRQLHVLINGVQHAVTLSGERAQVYEKEVMLGAAKFNSVQISLADGINRHKDMEVEGLVIRLEK